ncbi:MAG: neutral/alkaline non-lysosomal ceramidase N-terminal domain-containing protein, partial [Candidatus Hydrogenedentes bacterium]|nr:neutral/alkaline non-lysosomal ceramidase N-terminal domain-containing protein [Candidatus Hydrogenedentota bacterium]
TTTFYMVASDLCVISPAFYDDFTKRLEKETGISPKNVWWSTSHTHSGPHVGNQDLGALFAASLGDRFSIKLDTDYWTFVVDKIIAGIKEAQSKLEPARLGIGVGTAKANINRRELRDGKIVLGENPGGPVDRQLGLIRLERQDGSLIGLIANYAIHGTCLHGGNKQISGDVPGWVSTYVEEHAGAPMLFVNGAEGNVAPHPTVGNDITDPRIKSFEQTLAQPILELNKSITDTTNKVTLAIGKTIVETPRKEGLPWLEELAAYTATKDGTHCVRIPVFSLTINGDTAIWAAPLELFSEIAMNVRAASPFKTTMYYGLTNGSLMYLPTKAAFAEGGYEPSVSPFTPRAEEDFFGGVSQFLKSLK